MMGVRKQAREGGELALSLVSRRLRGERGQKRRKVLGARRSKSCSGLMERCRGILRMSELRSHRCSAEACPKGRMSRRGVRRVAGRLFGELHPFRSVCFMNCLPPRREEGACAMELQGR